jgi:CspA family cold shock protein
MSTATVAWYDPVRGFGFLKPSTGEKDVYVHRSALMRAGIATLEKGAAVQYTAEEGRNGKFSAVDLRLL